MLEKDSYQDEKGYLPPNQGVQEMLSRPDIIIAIFGSVFLLFLVAIRLTRVSLASTIQSYEEFVDGDEINKKALFSGWISGNNGIFRTFTSFWGKLPRRFWNFYIEAFLVPGYRKEWGQYQLWSYRSRKRPQKPPHIQKLLRNRKRHGRMSLNDDIRFHVASHNHICCQRIKINVCGMQYETQLRTVERFPDTLLGNPRKRIQYYDPLKQEYYFDRNRIAFEAILYFYQSGGRFRRPVNVQPDVLLEDAQFFQLSQAVVDQYRVEEGLSPQYSKHEVVPQSLLRRKIWLLFDTPESSVPAAYVAILSISALFLSIGVFCIETIEMMELRPKYGVVNVQTGRIGIMEQPHFEIGDPFFLVEAVCNAWFIIEFVTRFLCCPVYLKFLKSALNLIDLIALIPFIISALSPYDPRLIQDDDQDDSAKAKTIDSLFLLRILRVVRVFRIFKLSRHSRGLQILAKTLKASLNELILLTFFIILGVILFSSTIYFAELDHPNTQYESIPGGFWWALITITTVGFGDVVPKTFLGKIVGSLCAVAGVLTIALPVPVIVSNFNFFYHQAIDEGDLKWININHVTDCPYRPSQNVPQKKLKKSKTLIGETYSSDEDFGHLKQKGF